MKDCHAAMYFAKPRVRLIALFLLSIVPTFGMGTHGQTPQAPLDLAALYAYCGLPSACDAPTPWDGQTLTFWGRLDPVNVFDRQHYPQLPYEKFVLIDDKGHSVEVWVQSADSQAVFAKLAQRPSDRIVITGRLAAIRMPISSTCRTGIKAVIDDAEQIDFKSP